MRNASLIVLFMGLWIHALETSPVQASWTLVENYESLAIGSSIHGQNGWFAESGTGTSSRLIAVDPIDSSNKVLDIYSGGSSDMSRAMVVGANDAATLYGRFYIPALNSTGGQNEPDMQFGASTLNPPVAAASAGPAYRVDWDGSDYVLQVRNDANDGFLTPAILETGVWYQLWMTFDNATDLYGGYIQGGAFATQTQLDAAGQTEFMFRNRNSDPIATIAMRMNLNHIDDNVLADDFFLSPGTNLDVPELSLLSAKVNPLTGVIFLSNHTSDPISFDTYQITSSQGALMPSDGNWNSLDDQDYDAVGALPGQSWTESAGSSATILAERFLLGGTTLDPQEAVSLGSAYNSGVADPDMSLLYFDLGLETLLSQDLEFIVPGDMDGNGTLESADINPFVQALTNRAAFSSAYPDVLADLVGDFNGNSQLDLGDVHGMIAEIEAIVGVGESSTNSVPEPTSVMLLGFAVLILSTTWNRTGNSIR